MLHTAAGPKIDFKCLRLWKWRQWWNTFDNIGKCSSENYIWDCLLFWTNSFSSDSIPFFIKWKWMIGCIFHLFSVWWQKLLHHQFLFQEAEGLFFKRQLCNRKWLIQRKHFFCNKKVVCIMTRKLGEETFLWSSSNHLFPKIVISLGMHQNHFFSLRLIPSFFL